MNEKSENCVYGSFLISGKSGAKGAPRFGCAKQSNNLKRYLVGILPKLEIYLWI